MKWAQNALCVAITDSPILKNISTWNGWCVLVQAMMLTVGIWKKNGKTLARWKQHCHLPKFPSTTQMTV